MFRFSHLYHMPCVVVQKCSEFWPTSLKDIKESIMLKVQCNKTYKIYMKSLFLMGTVLCSIYCFFVKQFDTRVNVWFSVYCTAFNVITVALAELETPEWSSLNIFFPPGSRYKLTIWKKNKFLLFVSCELPCTYYYCTSIKQWLQWMH